MNKLKQIAYGVVIAGAGAVVGALASANYGTGAYKIQHNEGQPVLYNSVLKESHPIREVAGMIAVGDQNHIYEGIRELAYNEGVESTAPKIEKLQKQVGGLERELSTTKLKHTIREAPGRISAGVKQVWSGMLD